MYIHTTITKTVYVFIIYLFFPVSIIVWLILMAYGNRQWQFYSAVFTKCTNLIFYFCSACLCPLKKNPHCLHNIHAFDCSCLQLHRHEHSSQGSCLYTCAYLKAAAYSIGQRDCTLTLVYSYFILASLGSKTSVLLTSLIGIKASSLP